MVETVNKKPNRAWALVIIALALVIVISTAIGLIRYQPARPVEIRLPPSAAYQGDIQIGGAVTNPGIYPFRESDTIDSLLRAAGGTGADIASLKLAVPEPGIAASPQKININRAGAWLLEALPGIGATKAKAIIAYREKNGLFRQTSELMRVEGIGQTLYEQIKDLITVTD